MRRRGFTLLEAINLIALVLMLGALGMFAIARYLRHMKTAEAVGSVTAIAQAAAVFYEASDSSQPAGTPAEAARAMRRFPPSSKSSVPADAANVCGKKYQSAMTEWAVSPWVDMRFSIAQPQYFSYTFESTGGTQATATAHGDLDGDGKPSTFRMTVTPNASHVAVLADDVEKVDPEE